jgi:hypothetical protein
MNLDRSLDPWLITSAFHDHPHTRRRLGEEDVIVALANTLGQPPLTRSQSPYQSRIHDMRHPATLKLQPATTTTLFGGREAALLHSQQR